MNPYRFGASAPPPATDPYFSSVGLLLHGGGADNSTVITDSSGTPKTVTPYYNCRISTTRTVYGTGSIYCDGAQDYFSYPQHTDFDFGSGDLTIEFWGYISSIAASERIFQSRDGDVVAGLYLSGGSSSNTLQLHYSTNGTGFATAGFTFSANIDTWTHYAITRLSGIFSIWKGGVLQGTHGSAGALYYNAAHSWIWGGQSTADRSPSVFFYDVRKTKGIARYTGAGPFIVPPLQFPNS